MATGKSGRKSARRGMRKNTARAAGHSRHPASARPPSSRAKAEHENIFIQSFFGLSAPGAKHKAGDEQAHQLGNPLAISFSHTHLSYVKAQRLAALKRWQHHLWSLALALTIVLFFSLSLLELDEGITRWLPAPSAAMREFLFRADLMAIGIFALEFGAQYRQYKNKMLFFKHNWLGIVAILPIGLFARATRIFEGVEAFRAMQLAGKFNELSVVLPNLELTRTLRIAMPRIPFAETVLQAQNWLAHFSVFSDFSKLITEAIESLLRL